MISSCPKCGKEIRDVEANYCPHCGAGVLVQLMTAQEREELECRKVLLDSYNSHLNIHGSLIIGFAVVLLTLFAMKGEFLQSISPERFSLFYLGVFMASWAWWHLLCRHLVYGLLVAYAIDAEPSGTGNTLTRMLIGTNGKVLKRRILGVLPTCLFLSTTRKSVNFQMLCGYVICLILACFITLAAWILLG